MYLLFTNYYLRLETVRRKNIIRNYKRRARVKTWSEADQNISRRLHLATFFCEVENIINSRPLTTVSDDPNDLEPLTPNHLLQQKQLDSLLPDIFYPSDNYSRKQWRQIQYLTNIFWSRWMKEYLPLLQTRQKWFRTKRNLSVNDVVLVVDKSSLCGTWLLGRVIETFPDANNLIRSARVRTKYSVVLRPISKLCLIVPEKN